MGYIMIGLIAACLAVRSLFVDYFIDESESPPVTGSERERIGLKGTKATRATAFALFAGLAIWMFWKFFSQYHT